MQLHAAPRCVRARALTFFAALLLCAPPVVARATVSLNSTDLTAAGDWLLVRWNVSQPQPSDFLALVPADVAPPLTTSAFSANWSPLKLLPTYGTAAGNHSFYMLNWRTPVRWLLLRGGLLSPRVLARSEAVTWQLPNEPTGIHLSPTGVPTEMRVQWTTHNESAPYAFWRVEGGPGLASRAAATTSVLRRSSLCGDAAVSWKPTRPHELSSNATGMGWFDPGAQHTAVLTGLPPGERIAYFLGNESGPLSPEMSFMVPPAPGAASTLRFAAVADFGVADIDGSNWDGSGFVAPLVELSMRGWDNRPAKDTLARLIDEVDEGASLVLLNGDISYARGFSPIWEAFMHALSSSPGVASRAGLLTTIGNHESCWPGSTASAWNTSSLDSGGECGVAYAHRFIMPPPASLASPWYSYTSGPVHFVHLSTEHDLSYDSPQLSWLRTDLAARQRAGVPWVIVSAHRFFYISSSTPNRDAASGRALLAGGLEDIFLQYGVDLTLTGHHHSYQRTCHVYAGSCVPLRPDGSAAAPAHIVAGHAGAGLSGVSNVSIIMERIVLEHGYLRGVANATHLVITSRRSTDGGLLDELVLFKPQHGPPMRAA